MDDIAVSVIVMTYNHERYIEQALRSVLTQNVSWPWEILVADDRSTDATSAIIDRLAGEFPSRLTRLPRSQNLGLTANLADAWQTCRGRYIAILEGDDYWSRSDKLTQVITALDQHPDWVGCYHACEQQTLDASGQRTVERRPLTDPVAPLRLPELVFENVIQTFSVMTYRRGVIPRLPDWLQGLILCDWGLHLLHARHGAIGYLPETLGVYRKHPGGLMSRASTARRWLEHCRVLEGLWDDANTAERPLIRAAQHAFLDRLGERVDALQKIERRYQRLGLEWLATIGHGLKTRLWPKAASTEQMATAVKPATVPHQIPQARQQAHRPTPTDPG